MGLKTSAKDVIKYLIDIAGYSIERDLIYLEFDRNELELIHKDITIPVSKLTSISKTRFLFNYSTKLIILASWSETDTILSLLQVEPISNIEVTVITFDLQRINGLDFRIPKANRTPGFLYQLLEPLTNAMVPLLGVMAIGNQFIMIFEPLFSERALETLFG